MSRQGAGVVNTELAVRNGRLRKTIDIPVEYVPALAALAKAANRDLKNFFETELIAIALTNRPIKDVLPDKKELAQEFAAGLKIKFNPANANTGASIDRAKSSKTQPGNTFLESRRKLKTGQK